MARQPNVIVIFADQLRLQSCGYAGDTNAISPRIDAFAAESINFINAVSGCPVCSPARASLLTGQYPDRHGVFVNDVYLKESETSLGHVFNSAGYNTGYIGKWHIDGHGERHGVIPSERRQGFAYWKAMECTHSYLESPYYDNDSAKITFWDGYDATAQTRDACEYVRDYTSDDPFCLVLSWGPPHTPCGPPNVPGPNVPDSYLELFDPRSLELRENVGPESEEKARIDLASYYAHIKALDDCLGLLLDTLDDEKLAEDTVVVLWSDHGDMLGSQNQWKKQRPWDESIRVPLLWRYPREFGLTGRTLTGPINTPDILPTLLSQCGLKIPDTVDGVDYIRYMRGETEAPASGALVACHHPFGQFPLNGEGREYRAVRTERYTYARTLQGPWLLYDNKEDPFQLHNLVNTKSAESLQQELDVVLTGLLEKYHDEFLEGDEYMSRWGYDYDETGTPAYSWTMYPGDSGP